MQKKLTYYELETELLHVRTVLEDATRERDKAIAERNAAIAEAETRTERAQGLLTRARATVDACNAKLAEAESLKKSHEAEMAAARNGRTEAFASLEVAKQERAAAEKLRDESQQLKEIAESRAVVWAPWEIHNRDWYGVGNAVGLGLFGLLILFLVGRQIRRSLNVQKEHVGLQFPLPLIGSIILLSAASVLFWKGSFLELGYVLFGMAAAIILYYLNWVTTEEKIDRKVQAHFQSLESVRESERKLRAEEVRKAVEAGNIAVGNIAYQVEKERAKHQAVVMEFESRIAKYEEKMKSMKPLSPEQLEVETLLKRHTERVAQINALPLPHDQKESVIEEADRTLQGEIARIYKLAGYGDTNGDE